MRRNTIQSQAKIYHMGAVVSESDDNDDDCDNDADEDDREDKDEQGIWSRAKIYTKGVVVVPQVINMIKPISA